MTFKKLEMSLPQPTGSLSDSRALAKGPPPSKFPGPKEWAAEQERASPEFATERARLLFGCYPRGQANDPDVYVTAVAAVLCEYPAEVVRHVTDPRTGVARKIKFLPTIAEISDAADAAIISVWAPKYREAKEAQQRMLADGGQNPETRAQPMELR